MGGPGRQEQDQDRNSTGGGADRVPAGAALVLGPNTLTSPAHTCRRPSPHLPAGQPTPAGGAARTCRRPSPHLPAAQPTPAGGPAHTCRRPQCERSNFCSPVGGLSYAPVDEQLEKVLRIVDGVRTPGVVHQQVKLVAT